MTEFRRVTENFSTAGQLTPDDIIRAAADGFTLVLNNRPDGEEPGQATGAEMKAAAEKAGLTYRAIPFQGMPPPGAVAETAMALDAAKGPVLAYCRTGTRSIKAWAMAQALAGARTPDELIALAVQAGYDLSGAREALEHLSPRG